MFNVKRRYFIFGRLKSWNLIVDTSTLSQPRPQGLRDSFTYLTPVTIYFVPPNDPRMHCDLFWEKVNWMYSKAHFFVLINFKNCLSSSSPGPLGRARPPLDPGTHGTGSARKLAVVSKAHALELGRGKYSETTKVLRTLAIHVTSQIETRFRLWRQEVSYPVILQSMFACTNPG
jgi:hypothetical protein